MWWKRLCDESVGIAWENNTFSRFTGKMSHVHQNSLRPRRNKRAVSSAQVKHRWQIVYRVSNKSVLSLSSFFIWCFFKDWNPHRQKPDELVVVMVVISSPTYVDTWLVRIHAGHSIGSIRFVVSPPSRMIRSQVKCSWVSRETKTTAHLRGLPRGRLTSL